MMVATDVAARGLDISALPYVVNYDFPSSLETYIHRVGRTGRLAANGHAFSFFTRNLVRAMPILEIINYFINLDFTSLGITLNFTSLRITQMAMMTEYPRY